MTTLRMEMSFSQTIIKRLFSYIYISVLFEYKGCNVNVIYTKNGKIKHIEKRHFKSYDDALPIEAINFIKKLINKYPFFYLSTITESISQSIMEPCTKEGIQEDSDYIWVCIDKKWGAITKKEGIKEVESKFAKISTPDFILSPYVLLWSSIKEMLDSKNRLYVLNIKSSVTVLIANESGACYGAFFAILTNEMQNIQEIPSETHESEEEEIEEEKEVDFADTKESEDEELGEIKELDELDDIGLEEFDEGDSAKSIVKEDEGVLVNEVEAKEGENGEQPRDSLEEFTRVVEITNNIKESLEDYYKNPSIRSDFIDEVVIIDDTGLKKESIEYMSDALLLDIKKIDKEIGEELNMVAFREIEGGI